MRRRIGRVLSTAATAAALPAAVFAQAPATAAGRDSVLRAGEFSGHYTTGFQTSRFESCGALMNQGATGPNQGPTASRDSIWVEFDSAAVQQLYGGGLPWPKASAGERYPRTFVRWHGRLHGGSTYGIQGASPYQMVVTRIVELRAPTPLDCTPGAATAAAVASAAPAKPAPPPRKRWKTEADVSGNLLFGNTTQSIITTRNALTWSDSALALKSELRFTYGQAAGADRRAFVNRRSWLFTLSSDLWPHARQSAFLTGSYESSFERRIRSRTNAGVGHKIAFVRTPRSRLDVSLAILAERSALLTSAGLVTENDLARWSARFRADRKLNERISLTHETFYRPEYDSLERFTFSSSSSVGYQLARFAQIKVSFLDNYDSGARGRGARSNNDGQVVVGALTVF